MSKVEYSAKFDPATTAKAMAYELNVSPKHCIEILREIKGKKVSTVKTFLEDVIEKKKSVPFKRFNRNVGHKRHQTGWDAGRRSHHRNSGSRAVRRGLATDRPGRVVVVR